MRKVMSPIIEINPVTIDDLSPMQADFVRYYVELGGQKGSGEKAALLAGYSASGARVRASELKRNKKVRICIDEMLDRKLKDGVNLAIQVLYDLARDAPPSVKLSAAKELLDRSIGPVASRNTTHRGETVEDFLRILDQEDENKISLIESPTATAISTSSGNGLKKGNNTKDTMDRLARKAKQYAKSENCYGKDD